MPELKTCEQCKNAIPLGAFNIFLGGKVYCSACFSGRVKQSLPPPSVDVMFATQPAKVELRDWLAAHETLREWNLAAISLERKSSMGLVNRPVPIHGWNCQTPEEWRAMIQWEAEWLAAWKYIRADAMLKARAQ